MLGREHRLERPLRRHPEGEGLVSRRRDAVRRDEHQGTREIRSPTGQSHRDQATQRPSDEGHPVEGALLDDLDGVVAE